MTKRKALTLEEGREMFAHLVEQVGWAEVAEMMIDHKLGAEFVQSLEVQEALRVAMNKALGERI